MDVPVWRGKSLRNSPRSGYQSRPSPELHSGGYRKDVREPRATQFRTTTALAAPCSSVCPSPYTNPKVKTFSGKGVFDFSRGRDDGLPSPPAQLRTSSITAYGSY